MKALFCYFAIFLFGLPSFALDSDVIATDSNVVSVDSQTTATDSKITTNSKTSTMVSKISDPDCEPFEIDLQTVFSLVEAENLTVLLNREKIEQALQEAYIKRADLFPQITATFTPTRSRFAFNTGGRGGDRIAVYPANRFDELFNATFAVFDLTKIAGYRAAKMGWQVSELNYNAILQDVMTATAEAYFLYIRNLQSLDATDANIRKAEALLKLAEARFNAGVASSIDVNKAQVQVAVYKRDRLADEITIKQSELNLKQMLDIHVDQSIKVSYDSDAPRPKPNLQKPPLSCVFQNRYDYLTAFQQLQLNRYQQKAAAWAWYPSINAQGNYGYAAALAYDGDMFNEWMVGITASMPIFDGFRILSNVRQKGSLVRQQQTIVQELANTISTEFTLNSYTLELRYNEIDLTRQQVSLGEKELDLAEKRFKEGVADNTDVVLAQTALAIFRDEVVDILYLYDLSRLEWAKTLGDVRNILCDAN